MDPITLAVLTSGVVTLASESAKGLASQAGKDAWSKIKTLFAWKKEPADGELTPKVAEALNNNAQLAQQVLQLLQRLTRPASRPGRLNLAPQFTRGSRALHSNLPLSPAGERAGVRARHLLPPERHTSRPRVIRADRGGRVWEGPGGSGRFRGPG